MLAKGSLPAYVLDSATSLPVELKGLDARFICTVSCGIAGGKPRDDEAWKSSRRSVCSEDIARLVGAGEMFDITSRDSLLS